MWSARLVPTLPLQGAGVLGAAEHTLQLLCLHSAIGYRKAFANQRELCVWQAKRGCLQPLQAALVHAKQGGAPVWACNAGFCSSNIQRCVWLLSEL